jgi:hypothetical protein
MMRKRMLPKYADAVCVDLQRRSSETKFLMQFPELSSRKFIPGFCKINCVH